MSKLLVLLVVSIAVPLVTCQLDDEVDGDEVFRLVSGVSDCYPTPLPYRIPDEKFCDKYYLCRNGTKIERFCPQGTAFQFLARSCVLLIHADCSGRTLYHNTSSVQQGTTSPLCPQRFGLFPHENATRCDLFYHCIEGIPQLVQCPPTLLFDPKTGTCDFASRIDTSRCKFPEPAVKCPDGRGMDVLIPLPLQNRVPHPTNCRLWYLCEGKLPRLMGCDESKAFDPKTRECVKQDQVAECKKN